MRSTIGLVVFGIVMTVVLSGCGGTKGAKLQSSVVPPDKTLFQNGEEYLEKNQFIKARLAFQTLIRTYPGSDLEADAYLATGDSFYREGGTENFLMAEDQYRNFIIFFPTNPKAPDAQMKIISILMRQMRAPDRDQKDTERALGEIDKLITMFPSSDYVPIAKQYRDLVQENLAQRDMGVGDYYYGRENFFGAASRYDEAAKKYPHFSERDELFWKLGMSRLKIEDTDGAAECFTQIATGFPFSKHYEEAKAQLTLMGKPIPDVNSLTAAENESLLKQPEPFSPLKPLISFAEAIGFKGPPDRYEEANKIIAATKAENAAATAAATQTGDNPGDVIITGTIQKDANGKEITGTNPKVDPNATDKKDDTKKKEDPTKKKVVKK